MDSKEEILAKAQLGTYLEGLCDAYGMTKKQIEKTIDIIVENDDY